VRVGVAYDAGRLLLRVLDSGCGIAADQRQAIMAPFAQADDSLTRRHGGVGQIGRAHV
jgi:signal transduction histidine kinase